MIFPAQPLQLLIASMAGDSEALLKDHDENTNGVRQPFLIGVSGGTASGKVGTPTALFRRPYLLSYQIYLFIYQFKRGSLSLALVLPDANANGPRGFMTQG